MIYYWYKIDTGEYVGNGPNLPTEENISSTIINPNVHEYFDYDIGNTKQAFWTGSEWELREV